MKKLIQEGFLLGNEAIARGAVEAGVDVATAYPGTPSTEILESLAKVAKEYGIYVEWSVNEKVAFEVAIGGSLAGLRAMVSMKHAGFNWITDPLSVSVLGGVRGGFVIVTADDPGCLSSANEQDNRFYGSFFRLLTLEPSDPQEAKDMTVEAFSISEKTELPVVLRSVTRVSHARSNVQLGEIKAKERRASFVKDLDRFYITSKTSLKGHSWLLGQQRLLDEISDRLSFNKLFRGEGRRCIVASGVAYSYLKDALRLLKSEEPTILKIGCPYPLPKSLIKEAVLSKETILVVEEGAPFVELQLKTLAFDLGARVRILGKMSGDIPEVGELNVNMLAERVARFLGKDLTQAAPKEEVLAQDVLPPRTLTFCPGCPHNALAFAVSEVVRKRGREPFMGLDIGCYNMMSGAPYHLGTVKYSMGASIGVAAGMSKALGEKTIAFIGDGTFFHAGIPPLINSVCNKSNIMVVICDNKTIAMTGGQPNPGTGSTAIEGETKRILLEDLVKACGVEFVQITDPYDVNATVKVVEKALDYVGTSVVISSRDCALEADRIARKTGKQFVPYCVEQDKCISQSSPYCQAACPLHIDSAGYIGLIRVGKFDEALRLIKDKLPFPGIMGRICTHPCESTCKRGEFDEPVAINALKRSAVDYGKVDDEDLATSEERKEKIAIVGGGPAGLMASYDLRKRGYQVTVFEASPFLGGMLATGVPRYRLPREILNSEISVIERLGVRVKLNSRVGVDVKLSDLRREFDSVFVATGADISEKAGIENWDDKLEGCANGVEFLRRVNLGQKVQYKDRVVIIGGGSVAVDCARSCLRLGFKDVAILYRRSRVEIPGRNDEIEEAEKEGAKIECLVTPIRVVAENGKVLGVECLRTKLGDFDETGRRRPIPIKGSEFFINTDMIISATGERPDLSVLRNTEIGTTGEGLIYVNQMTLETNVPGIFAGGDAVTGPATVIEALAAGRKAAISIHRYVSGQDLTTGGREKEGPFKSGLAMEVKGIISEKRLVMPTLSVRQRHETFDEVELGFTREEAIKEAQRSLSCECRVCMKFFSCPAIMKEDGQNVIDSSVCNGCSVCAQICPHQAIIQESSSDKSN